MNACHDNLTNCYIHFHEKLAISFLYRFLELSAFIGGHSVCFGHQGDDVDFVMESLHELNVQ